MLRSREREEIISFLKKTEAESHASAAESLATSTSTSAMAGAIGIAIRPTTRSAATRATTRATTGATTNATTGAATNATTGAATRANTGARPGAVLRRISDIPTQKLCWLWPGRIPLGKLTLFAGDPGLGKSFVTLDIAARVTRGFDWPDGASCEAGSVIILSAEDDAADTIRPRLEAAHADLRNVHVLQAVRRPKPGGDTSLEHFNLEIDLLALLDAAALLDNVRLIVLDPISAYLGSTDSHVNARVRGLLAPLAAFAHSLGVAVVAVDHLSKSNRPAIYRPDGSIAFTAAARAVWLFAKNPDDAARRFMLPGKMNLAPDQTGLSYALREEQPGVVAVAWGGAVNLSADAVLQPEAVEERSERIEAMEWLRTRLADGPVSAAQIRDEAKSAGLAWRTLRRGKEALGITAIKGSFDGAWRWQWPALEPAPETPKGSTAAEGVHPREVDPLGKVDPFAKNAS